MPKQTPPKPKTERLPSGLTLRQHYASKALIGLVAAQPPEARRDYHWQSTAWEDEIAKNAWRIADAMERTATD